MTSIPLKDLPKDFYVMLAYLSQLSGGLTTFINLTMNDDIKSKKIDSNLIQFTIVHLVFIGLIHFILL